MSEPTRSVYRAHGVEIDGNTGLIRRNGTETHLRHKSHQVLVHLIEHRSGPVHKDDLMRLVWAGAAVTDDTLVNCVQEIRKALGDDARDPKFIRTMPKTGYWFVAPLEEPWEAPALPPKTEVPAKAVQTRWKAWAAAAALVSGLSVFAVWSVWDDPTPPRNRHRAFAH